MTIIPREIRELKKLFFLFSESRSVFLNKAYFSDGFYNSDKLSEAKT